MSVVPPELNTSGIEPPVEKLSVPVWPLRSGRTPKVIAISGAVPSGQVGVTSIAKGVGCGIEVEVDEVVVGARVVVVVVPGSVVVVVEAAVVVGATVVVVVGATVVVVVEVVVGAVVVDVVVGATVVVVVELVEVVEDVVVVVPVSGGGHSSTPGSSCPTSKARTYERPCASLKYWPGLRPGCQSIEMGFCPVCNRSSIPGVPSYLQTKTLTCPSGSVVVELELGVVEVVDEVVAAVVEVVVGGAVVELLVGTVCGFVVTIVVDVGTPVVVGCDVVV